MAESVASHIVMASGRSRRATRVMQVAVALTLITGGAVWSIAAAYELAMSVDKDLCAAVLEMFNSGDKKAGVVSYDHEAFRQISWSSVNLGGQAPKVHRCNELERALFDIDNNGGVDVVVRTTFCMKGLPSDSLYIFPTDSPVLEQATWQDLSPLLATQNKFERTGMSYPLTGLPAESRARTGAALGTVFTLRPFRMNDQTYVSLTDSRAQWIVIAKYLQGEQFQDLCYLRAGARQ